MPNNTLPKHLQLTFVLGFFFIFPAFGFAGDWPVWQGPNGNGMTSEKIPDLNKLSLKWKKEVGLGYSGLIVADGKLYTLGHDGESKETLFCLDLLSGKTIWKMSYPGELIAKLHAGGPNASPLILGDKLFSLSKDGQLFCLKTEDGSVIWKENLTKILDSPVPNFGFACSPKIIEGQLILSQGKTASLDPATGKVNWVSDTEGEASYSTPKLIEVKGKKYLIAMSSLGANIIDFSNGKHLAHFAMRAKYNMIAVTPILLDKEGEFFVSTNQTASRLSFNGKKLTALWTTTKMKNNFSNSLFIDGYLYGVDGAHKSKRTRIVCINAVDGKVAWTQEKTGHGSLIAGSNHMIFFSEAGELVTLEINPKKFRALAKKKVLSGICWTPPTLSHGTLYVRNEDGTVLSLAP
jgi:outer membrane protein assembly factor BamB